MTARGSRACVCDEGKGKNIYSGAVLGVGLLYRDREGNARGSRSDECVIK